MSSNPILVEGTFNVTEVDKGGKKYHRVSRLQCDSPTTNMALTIDINSDIFPVVKGEKLTIALAHTLSTDGQYEGESYDHTVFDRVTVMTSYDYAMHGRVYECNTDAKSEQKVYACISFGGLLMRLDGKPDLLKDIGFNKQVYLLIKRVKA